MRWGRMEGHIYHGMESAFVVKDTEKANAEDRHDRIYIMRQTLYRC